MRPRPWSARRWQQHRTLVELQSPGSTNSVQRPIRRGMGLLLPRNAVIGMGLVSTIFMAIALGKPTAASAAPASATQIPAVQAHLLWARHDSASVSQQLDRVQAAGAKMVRVDVGWSSLQQDGPEHYNEWYLSKIDYVVEQAAARNLELLFTFWETPCWASTAPADLKQDCEGAWWERGVQRYAPSDPALYAKALAYLVARYRDRVAAWEIWNEPNHSDFFKTTDPAASYARLVRTAYPAAKAAYQSSTIVAGSLADSDFEFTNALYQQGIRGYFDAWSVHPYSEDRSPLDSGIKGWEKKSFIDGVPRVRDVMLAHDDDKPLWLTEFGWSTCDVRDDRSYRNCVDPDIQADYLRLAYEQMRQWDYVAVGVWFNLADTTSDPSDRVGNYGLRTHDDSPKPAFAAFSEAAATLGGPQESAYPEEPSADEPSEEPSSDPGDPPVPPSDDGDSKHDKPKPTRGAGRGGGPKASAIRLRTSQNSRGTWLRLIRKSKGVTILGGSRHRTLVLHAYRVQRKGQRTHRRLTARLIVRVSRSKRFRRQLRLPRRRQGGHWQLIVRTPQRARKLTTTAFR